mmetsp:Transcript_47835/g.94738  ORF Transcript_47835/g.94738 Transcript_47835/m.94738 type:complete len:314 (+) Transcript_47835:20-961(+)
MIVPIAPEDSQTLTFAVSSHTPRRTRHHFPATRLSGIVISAAANCAIVTSCVPRGSSRDAGQARSGSVVAEAVALSGVSPAAATSALMSTNCRPSRTRSAMYSPHSFIATTKWEATGEAKDTEVSMPAGSVKVALTPAGQLLPGAQEHSGCMLLPVLSSRTSYTYGPREGTTKSTSAQDMAMRSTSTMSVPLLIQATANWESSALRSNSPYRWTRPTSSSRLTSLVGQTFMAWFLVARFSLSGSPGSSNAFTSSNCGPATAGRAAKAAMAQAVKRPPDLRPSRRRMARSRRRPLLGRRSIAPAAAKSIRKLNR